MLVDYTLGIYEPFYVSSAGYGLFVHGSHVGYYDLAATDTTQIHILFDDTQLTFSVLPGPDVPQVMRRLPLLTGRSIVPPLWAFRPLRWRDNHVNKKKYYDGTRVTASYNSQVVEDLLMARAYDIPVGAYWVDRPWASGVRGYGNLRWDPVRFPDAQGMIDWINGKGMHFLVWIAPWAQDSLLLEAKEKGYLMPGMEKVLGENRELKPWLVNLTDPAAARWWEDLLRQRLIKMGVAGFKMDRSEEIIRKIDTLTLPDGTRIHDIRNIFPRAYIKAAHDALHAERGDDFLAMPRAGYTGSQQYGVFWGGDIGAGQYGLRTALIAVQRCAFMNFPLWGSDIGGYWKHPLSHYNVARWLAFGAFTPIMEVGPLDDRAPWDMPYEPHYDTALIAIYRTYSILHDTLKEYSHAMAVKASEEGIPIVRPLVMIFPEDKNVTGRWDEFMYGDNFLVGIPWQDGQYSFEMYLPEGNWKDVWSGKTYEGGQTVTIACPDHKIPIFVTGDNPPALPDLNKLYEESLKIASVKPDLAKLESKEFK
jgi:alpha-glucosidase (family GH31 glycosyl hydrolase)